MKNCTANEGESKYQRARPKSIFHSTDFTTMNHHGQTIKDKSIHSNKIQIKKS